jgi:hypothetical protein
VAELIAFDIAQHDVPVGGRDLGREVLRAQVQGTASIEDDPDGLLVEDLVAQVHGRASPGFAGPNPQWVTVRNDQQDHHELAQLIARWPERSERPTFQRCTAD